MTPDYSYQKQIENKVTAALKAPGSRVVLAAGCGAGKTRMATNIIGKTLRAGGRVLVLTHGQKILRTQFARSLIAAGLDPHIVTKGRKLDPKRSLVVGLPQTLRGVAKIGTYGLIVVDEAHQFYTVKNGTVTKILAKTRHKAELLLTATPSPFVAARKEGDDSFHFIVIPQTDLVDYGVITDPEIILVPTAAYRFKINDYSKDDNLKQSTKITPVATRGAITSGLKILEDELGVKGAAVFHRLGKAMLAVPTQAQAKAALKFFHSISVNAVASTCDADPGSVEIERFLTDETVRVLVVVGRGVLGFDCPAIGATLDLTGSLNPDRLFQLLNRVSRRNGKAKKYYLKVMPSELAELGSISLSCAVALGLERVLLEYAGIYQIMEVVKPTEDHRYKPTGPHQTKMPAVFRVPAFKLMRSLDASSGVSRTSYREMRQQIVRRTDWTYNACQAEALKYQSRDAFDKGSSGAARFARRHGWFEQICAHMPIKQQSWSKERCAAEAAKYKRRIDLKNGCPGAYYAIDRNGWKDELLAHMPKQNEKGFWTKEKVLAVARQCRNATEFYQGHSAAHAAAKRMRIGDQVKRVLSEARKSA